MVLSFRLRSSVVYLGKNENQIDVVMLCLLLILKIVLVILLVLVIMLVRVLVLLTGALPIRPMSLVLSFYHSSHVHSYCQGTLRSNLHIEFDFFHGDFDARTQAVHW